jgi:hypothetical protein
MVGMKGWRRVVSVDGNRGKTQGSGDGWWGQPHSHVSVFNVQDCSLKNGYKW